MAARRGRNLIGVNAAGLREFTRDFRKADQVAAKVLTGRFREVAKPIAEAAKVFAKWSRRIPRSIRITGTGANIKIVAGGRRAPHAITFEAPEGHPRRHPVYAKGPRSEWTWAPQTPRRFLRPAADDEHLDAAAEAYGEILDDVTRSFGFRPGG